MIGSELIDIVARRNPHPLAILEEATADEITADHVEGRAVA